MNNSVVGAAAMVIGLLGFWQRDHISQLNRGRNKRLGKAGRVSRRSRDAKYFGIGAMFLVLAGRPRWAGQMTSPLRS